MTNGGAPVIPQDSPCGNPTLTETTLLDGEAHLLWERICSFIVLL